VENKKKSKLVTIRKRSEFEELREKGKRFRPCPWMILNYRQNNEAYLRCGWTFPKYVGNAVVRNRLKRWSREYLRTYGSGTLRAPFDFNVVLLRQKKDFYKYVDRAEYIKQLEKAVKFIEQQSAKIRSENI
jgi:ribonuclease P protein component